MPTRERVQAFVAMVEANKFVEAIREFYTDDATMQENLGEVRRASMRWSRARRRRCGASSRSRRGRARPSRSTATA